MDITTTALWLRGATDLAEAIRSGRISSRRILRANLQRIRAIDPSIDTVTVVLTEQAREATKGADRLRVDVDLTSFRSIPFTRRFRRRLLACGILASALWIGTDVLAGALSEGYSFISQSASELSAPGAPTRSLAVPLNLTYDALMIAFAVGLWGSDEKRALRLSALMVAGNAILGALAVLFFPWHPDDATSAPANTMNVIIMASSVFCFLLAMAFGAAAFRNWFRVYSIGTLAAYGVLTVLGIALGSQNGERASVGIQERTMVFGYLLWVVMLAVVLLRSQRRPGLSGD